MASNYNRKSDSSASRRPRGSAASFRSRSGRSDYQVIPGGRATSSSRAPRSGRSVRNGYDSVRVGDVARSERMMRAQERSRAFVLRIGAVAAVIAVIMVAFFILRSSSVFSIDQVSVVGVEHLTADDMAKLANVPAGSTLLDVDTAAIEERVRRNAWVAGVSVSRKFPHTLEISVTERTVSAVVEVPSTDAKSIKQWAISSDHIWLMPIPEKGSAGASTTSSKVYEDADAALHITDVPFGTKAEIGQKCTDSNVLNALDIVGGMTTELAGKVKTVSAAGEEETTLILDDGIEIAFGKAEGIRDKERVVLKIIEENKGKVSYINVRSVSNPTWRALS